MEIYLDNAATTKPCPQAISAVMEALTDNWGNPSAVHQLGLRAEKAVKHAREQVAHAMGCNPEQLFFTSGGTEGDNFAVFSVAQKYHKRGRHIITQRQRPDCKDHLSKIHRHFPHRRRPGLL